MKNVFTVMLLVCLLSGCAPAADLAPTAPAATAPAPAPMATQAPTRTAYPTPTSAPTWTPPAVLTPGLEGTFADYAADNIVNLRKREYGGGRVDAGKKVLQNKAFTRYLITYPSDGLTIYGYADIPRDEYKHPVLILLHGHSNPEQYTILSADTAYAEMYARAGYIVLHPNMRDYRPSDHGDNHFLAGMAVDVLNLIAIVKSQAGQPGPFQNADSKKIGLWAFSMGGAIALRVLTISPDVKAAFLYSAMSGDDYQNSVFLAGTGDAEAAETLKLPASIFAGTSPQNFYAGVSAVVDIHHGLADTIIPASWAQKTCDQLKMLGKTVNCYFYAGMDHVFEGNDSVKLKLRMINFFNTYLKDLSITEVPTP